MRLPSQIACVSVAFIVSVFLPSTLQAAARPATQEDLEWMRYAGFQNPQVGTLVNPDDPNAGKDVGEIKKWLAQHATRNVNVSCFNPDFARKLKNMMQEVPGGPPTITDGYRSPEAQARLPAGSTRVGPCGSYHQYGQAADFNTPGQRAKSSWMRANSKRFGINTIGEWDYNHFQDGAGKIGQCGACSGGTGGMGQLTGSGSPSPSGGLAQSLRQMLGLPQQPMQPPQQIPPPSLPQAQSPLNAFQPQPNTPTITIPPGDSGTRAPTSSSSASDILKELAFGNSATQVQSATKTVPVVVTAGEAAMLSGTMPQPTIASTTPYYPNSVHTEQTFTSDDLAWEPTPDADTLGTLTRVRFALMTLMEYLKPFGRPPTEAELIEEGYVF